MALPTPRGILFDFGGTLCTEPEFNPMAGCAALLEIAADRGRAEPEEIQREVDRVVDSLPAPVDRTIEITSAAITRLVYERFGVVFDRPDEDLEETFLNHAYGDWVAEPGISELLDSAGSAGIPTGVLSNIAYSGRLLTSLIERAAIRHDFRFVLATADYGIRKPHPEIFVTAAAKLGVPPEEIWFCGDNPAFDAAGARAAGMVAILYDPSGRRGNDPRARLRIRHWDELSALLTRVLYTPPGAGEVPG